MNKEKAIELINNVKWESEQIIYARETREYDMVDVYVADGGVIWNYIVYRDGSIRKALMSSGESHEVRRRTSCEL